MEYSSPIILKAIIEDRGYNNWSLVHGTTFEDRSSVVDKTTFYPANAFLFHADVFNYDLNTCKIEILHSSVRSMEDIPCVLILDDSKTYGRNSKKKLMYKCVPDDNRLPAFLVPYDVKNVGFIKTQPNMYVTIRFNIWNGAWKHPLGTLSQIIGPVSVTDNFYEYQLYCKSLHCSIQKFTKDTTAALRQYRLQKSADSDDPNNQDDEDAKIVDGICTSNKQIEDRCQWNIFTIDPEKSLDFDDAFSVKRLDSTRTMISIYIANVTLWLDSLSLWDSFSKRISTIYLPDRKRPMLPTVLSDCLCSLQENVTRIAFVMDVIVLDTCMEEAQEDHLEVEYVKFTNCKVRVRKNFVYEEKDLLDDYDYNLLLVLTKQVHRTYKLISSVRNSHDLVSFLMIFMNHWTAKELIQFQVGICRATTSSCPLSTSLVSSSSSSIKRNDILTRVEDIELPDEVQKFITIWNSASGQYIDIEKVLTKSETRHELLELDAYAHITSPIRRLVDLLNMIQLQEKLGLIKLSNRALQFYKQWIDQLDYINVTMRAIRKIQTDSNLLHLCSKNPEIVVEKEYEGYCFDKIIRNDGLYHFIVFLPELRIASRVTMRENVDNFAKRRFKLFLFHDEARFKKKIRLQIL